MAVSDSCVPFFLFNVISAVLPPRSAEISLRALRSTILAHMVAAFVWNSLSSVVPLLFVLRLFDASFSPLSVYISPGWIQFGFDF